MARICITCGNSNPDGTTTCEACQSALGTTRRLGETQLSEKARTTFFPGELIAGRYEVVAELGRGGMGVVYRVKDTMLRDRDTALKMIHPELVANPEARKRFEDEVSTCLDLNHPAIIRVYNLERAGELHFFTMEYLAGKSLAQLIAARKGGSLPLFELSEVEAIMSPLLTGLSYAHQYTIHRDLKPDNVMVLGEFPKVQIKLLDFGIARTMSASRFTQTAQAIGTPYYMAPEQLQGSNSVDSRADIYSVGMIIYEMLTGELAMGRFPLPSELVEGIPSGLDDLVEHTLNPFPNRRISEVSEVKKLLLEALDVSSSTGKVQRKRNEKKSAKRPPDKNVDIFVQQKEVTKENSSNPIPGRNFIEPKVSLEMIWVPGGDFDMGDGWGDGLKHERPVHRVTLDGFWIGKYPVKQKRYQQVVGTNPSEFNNKDNPVESVGWEDVQVYLERLASLTGKPFRLPTEAEWEYAARSGGLKENYSGGDEVDLLGWYVGNSGGGTHLVGQKLPNGLGIFDMSGNVFEWCQDWYGENYYSNSPSNNPTGPSSGLGRVIRGGSWNNLSGFLRSTYRAWGGMAERYSNVGFRLVLPAER